MFQRPVRLLCRWCSKLFWNISGTLEVHGPSPGLFACTLGVPCAVQLTGAGLASSNRVRVAPACSAADAAGFAPSAPGPTTGAQSAYDLGTNLLGTPGVYRLCWGVDAAPPPALDVGLTLATCYTGDR